MPMPNAVRGLLSIAIWMFAGYTATNVAAPIVPPILLVDGFASKSPDVSSAAPLTYVQVRGRPGTHFGMMLSNCFGAAKCSTPMNDRKPASRSRDFRMRGSSCTTGTLGSGR
ncbi:MAG: hypothetical protein QOG30_1377 [Acidimicrobiaceae bacterium]